MNTFVHDIHVTVRCGLTAPACGSGDAIDANIDALVDVCLHAEQMGWIDNAILTGVRLPATLRFEMESEMANLENPESLLVDHIGEGRISRINL